MSSKRNSLVLPPSLPAAARKLFERFPVPAGDDERSYRLRLADGFTALRPTDSIEAFWVKDFVDLTLEMERLRQIEAGLFEAQARDEDHSRDALDRHFAEVWANLAVVQWADDRGLDHRSNTPEIKTQWALFYEEYLSERSHNHPSRDISVDPNDLVQSFLRHSTELDRIGRMIAVAAARRQSVVQELEQYRAAKRARTRRAGRSHASLPQTTASR
jgi:hypothetical protein